MKTVVCPVCGGLYEPIGRNVLQGVSDELVYTLTHCVLCKTPSDRFLLVAEDASGPGPNAVRFPEVVVPWM